VNDIVKDEKIGKKSVTINSNLASAIKIYAHIKLIVSGGGMCQILKKNL
jgi:hypothetical protein